MRPWRGKFWSWDYCWVKIHIPGTRWHLALASLPYAPHRDGFNPLARRFEVSSIGFGIPRQLHISLTLA